MLSSTSFHLIRVLIELGVTITCGKLCISVIRKKTKLLYSCSNYKGHLHVFPSSWCPGLWLTIPGSQAFNQA